MKHITVNPGDIRIVSAGGGFGDTPRPGGFGGWLRRYRIRLAVVIALVEALLWLVPVSHLLLLAVAVGAVLLHFYGARHLRWYAARQLSWTIAFAQVLVALGSIAHILLSALLAFMLFVILLVLVVIGAAALLRDH